MANIQARQTQAELDDYYGRYDSFWYTREGYIVKWSIFFGLLFLLVGFLVAARWHAMRRIRKNLPPLFYHRWLLSRRQRAIHEPAYRDPQIGYYAYPPPNVQYGMYPMPPPAYDPNAAPLPVYVPPGNTKIDPTQAAPAQNHSYTAPAGPPPVQTNNTGSSNPFRG